MIFFEEIAYFPEVSALIPQEKFESSQQELYEERVFRVKLDVFTHILGFIFYNGAIFPQSVSIHI